MRNPVIAFALLSLCAACPPPRSGVPTGADVLPDPTAEVDVGVGMGEPNRTLQGAADALADSEPLEPRAEARGSDAGALPPPDPSGAAFPTPADTTPASDLRVGSTEVLAFGSPWRWRLPTRDPGPSWAASLDPADLDRTGWTTGPAPFRGYALAPGERPDAPDGVTPLELPADAVEEGEGPFVWLFATSFDLEDPASVVALLAEVSFSGGLVAWLNGEEVFRSNVAPETAFDDPAMSVEPPRWIRATHHGIFHRAFPGLAPVRLRESGNVLAVEVHRSPESDAEPPVYLDLRLSVHRAAGFVKTPYLMDPRAAGVTVGWETSVPTTGAVLFGSTGVLDHRTDDESPCTTHHEVPVDGLSPGVEYTYAVEFAPCPAGSPLLALSGTLRAAPSPGTPFSFLAYGDSRSNARKHAAVVDAMTDWAESLPAFVVNTGDLTRYGDDYQAWNDEFFTPSASLLASVPIVPVFGNHDSLDESWYEWFALPGNESWYSVRAGDVELFVLSAYARLNVRSEQTEWLAEALAASDAPWKIVSVHQPLRSCAQDRERRRAAERLSDILTPVLVEGGVRLVLSGHDHFYGRSREEDGFVSVTTGGGGAGLYSVRVTGEGETCAKAYHFCVIDVASDSLRVRAIDLEGTILDDFSIAREQPPAGGDGAESAGEGDAS
ncbi:MAG: metallophosphoesterase [Deltaproteobacteria bacterium]|nr:metallophosphoesterase [Deltaproteobacteria bacterium]